MNGQENLGADIRPRVQEDQPATAPARVRIGGFCIKGGGHIYTYDPSTAGADGCNGWGMFVEIDPEDVHLFPEWVQECYRNGDYR